MICDCENLASDIIVKMNNCIVQYQKNVSKRSTLIYSYNDESMIQNTLFESIDDSIINADSYSSQEYLLEGISSFIMCTFTNISHCINSSGLSVNSCYFKNCSNIININGNKNIVDSIFEKCDNISIKNGASDLKINDCQFINCHDNLIEHQGNCEIKHCQFITYSAYYYAHQNNRRGVAFNFTAEKDRNQKISNCSFDSVYLDEGCFLATCIIDNKSKNYPLLIEECKFTNFKIKSSGQEIIKTHHSINQFIGKSDVESIRIINCTPSDLETVKSTTSSTSFERKQKTSSGDPIGANVKNSPIGLAGFDYTKETMKINK
jgi:hypothetical protein